MLFSSIEFLPFFAAYLALHLLLPARYRIALIIAGSTFFYAWWKPAYVWLPFLLTAIAAVGVRLQPRQPGTHRARLAMILVALFLPLIVFKYANFLYQDVFGPLFDLRGRVFDHSLPLGVSFMTFTLTAYVVDTWRGQFTMPHRLSSLFGFVLFFPHLIAGPILRPAELIPQLEHPRATRLRRFAAPVALFTVGLVKKIVFADQIAILVDAAYAAGAPNGAMALLAWYGFSAQIYCDFSGYTDMAIALAMMLGVRLPNNFRRPYASSSVSEFWRRWHITLSSWLRDYLYVPLGGNRGSTLVRARNVMITMTLGGLWHGANWTFVVWGMFHGAGVAVSQQFRNRQAASRVPRWLGVLVTFHFVTIGWVFFRAPNLGSAVEMIAAPFAASWSGGLESVSLNIFPVLLMAIFFACHRFDDHRRVSAAVRYVRPEVLWPALAFLWVTVIAISQGNSAKFIYFDF